MKHNLLYVFFMSFGYFSIVDCSFARPGSRVISNTAAKGIKSIKTGFTSLSPVRVDTKPVASPKLDNLGESFDLEKFERRIEPRRFDFNSSMENPSMNKGIYETKYFSPELILQDYNDLTHVTSRLQAIQAQYEKLLEAYNGSGKDPVTKKLLKIDLATLDKELSDTDKLIEQNYQKARRKFMESGYNPDIVKSSRALYEGSSTHTFESKKIKERMKGFADSLESKESKAPSLLNELEGR